MGIELASSSADTAAAGSLDISPWKPRIARAVHRSGTVVMHPRESVSMRRDAASLQRLCHSTNYRCALQ